MDFQLCQAVNKPQTHSITNLGQGRMLKHQTQSLSLSRLARRAQGARAYVHTSKQAGNKLRSKR
eukprot:4253095-Amphidinium_carterae.1